MEYLDTYNEQHEFVGTFSREEVHEKGLWHNTIHCWLYDDEGNVYFQVRSDANKLYTTSSGHVQAGESLNDAFGREVKEEIGIDVDYSQAELLKVIVWKMDKEKNGKLVKDRAFANVYILNIKDHEYNFSFSDNEVCGVVKLNASEVLDLFNDKIDVIKGIFYDENKKEEKDFRKEDFLLMPNETLLIKYGYILEAIKRK